MNFTKTFISVFIVCIIQSPCSFAQLNLNADIQNYMTHRNGVLYGFGLGYTMSKTTINVGMTYSDLSKFRQNKDLVTEGGGTFSNGFGIKLNVTSLFDKENSSGMFWGLRGDLQFLEDETTSIFSFPFVSKSKAYMAMGQLGYLIKWENQLSAQLQISGGYVGHEKSEKNFILLLGIQVSRAFNL